MTKNSVLHFIEYCRKIYIEIYLQIFLFLVGEGVLAPHLLGITAYNLDDTF